MKERFLQSQSGKDSLTLTQNPEATEERVDELQKTINTTQKDRQERQERQSLYQESQSARILPVIKTDLFPQSISKEINNPTKNSKGQFVEKNDSNT